MSGVTYVGTQYSLLNNKWSHYSNGNVDQWIDKVNKTPQMRSPVALSNQFNRPRLYSAVDGKGFALTFKKSLSRFSQPQLQEQPHHIVDIKYNDYIQPKTERQDKQALNKETNHRIVLKSNINEPTHNKKIDGNPYLNIPLITNYHKPILYNSQRFGQYKSQLSHPVISPTQNVHKLTNQHSWTNGSL